LYRTKSGTQYSDRFQVAINASHGLGLNDRTYQSYGRQSGFGSVSFGIRVLFGVEIAVNPNFPYILFVALDERLCCCNGERESLNDKPHYVEDFTKNCRIYASGLDQ
jgi:hypothetical protein